MELVGEAGDEVQEAVGTLRSTVTEGALSLADGAALPAESEAALAASLNITVPSEQEATVTVIDEPELAEGVNTQPVAVPVLLKSAEVKPLTVFEIPSV